MMHTILFYAGSFAIQTVILALALWIMILVQKLNCNYPGLIGAAALTVALDMVFEAVLPRFMDDSLADYIARPIVVGVLCFCIAKVTGTTRMYDTDVIFTVAVSYALTFCFNLFLLGAMIGDLRHHDATNEQPPDSTMQAADEPEPAAETNATTTATIQPVAPAPAKTPPPAATTPKTKEPVSSKLDPAILKLFSLKGVMRNTAKPMALLGVGAKTYNIETGETLSLDTPGGKTEVKCVEVSSNWALFTIGGTEQKLYLH